MSTSSESSAVDVPRIRIGGEFSFYGAVRAAFALVLLAAASLKAQVLLASFGPASRLAWITVGCEWLLGFWLLTNFAPLWARRVALSLLAVFIAVAGWRLARGESDCGCFGRVHVHPGLTLGLDVLAFVAMVVLGRTDRSPVRLAGAAGVAPRVSRVASALILSASISGALLWPAPRSRGGAAGEIIDPRASIGRRFALLDALDEPARADLERGERTVILFDRNCEVCRAYLSRLESQRRAGTLEDNVCIIDIATVDAGPAEVIAPNLSFAVLRKPVRLIGPVPMRVSLQNGVLKSVDGPELARSDAR